ncbi:MAG: MBL fold metallo-hydrolase [Desulfobulbaceae bacterium]|nr:MBL fold metallo-hydrolase [Desulfobulbaceae bacterium]
MKITEHFHAIKIPFLIPIAPGRTLARFVYSYLVFGSSVCLVDSGVKGSDQVIYDYMRDLERDPQDIRMLILTHAHPDHIGSAAAIKKHTGCAVLCHPQAKAWIEDVDLQFRERPVPGFHILVGGSVTPDRFLEEAEIIDLGGISLQTYYTPGHSPDSLALFCPEEGVLIAGDAIPQQNDLPIYDDAPALAASIVKMKKINGLKYLLSSWSNPATGDDVMRMLDGGLVYLNTIHRVFRSIMQENEIMSDPMQFCALMAGHLGLPEAAVNPIVAQSFVSHLAVLGKPELP